MRARSAAAGEVGFEALDRRCGGLPSHLGAGLGELVGEGGAFGVEVGRDPGRVFEAGL